MTASELIQALLRLDPEAEVLTGHRLLCPVTAVSPVRCGTGEVFIHIDHSTATKAEIEFWNKLTTENTENNGTK